MKDWKMSSKRTLSTNKRRHIHKQVFACSICQRSVQGYGNNAAPINDGRCCDNCNSNVVIPARIERMYAAMAAEQPARDA
jgi:hypothetical protein